jgi:hypothetical protein
MKAVRSRPTLFVAIAIAAVIAAVVTAYAAGTAHSNPQSVAVQPTGMSVPF